MWTELDLLLLALKLQVKCGEASKSWKDKEMHSLQ